MSKNKIKSLSSNTLFHFTDSIEKLFSILINDFYPRYSLEFYSLFFPKSSERAIPMVSFCDIPLSQVSNHSTVYGSYALGLSKSWGIKKNICPVIYVYKNSRISQMYEIIENELLLNDNIEISSDSKIAITEIYRYLKPYEGRLWRNGKLQNKKVRFYDEKEWRFIPSYKSLHKYRVRGALSKDKYDDNSIRNDENKKLEVLKLTFQPNDIKYIIVKNEKEILTMLDRVINIKRGKFTYEDVQLLTTRILTMEQILDDF